MLELNLNLTNAKKNLKSLENKKIKTLKDRKHITYWEGVVNGLESAVTLANYYYEEV